MRDLWSVLAQRSPIPLSRLYSIESGALRRRSVTIVNARARARSFSLNETFFSAYLRNEREREKSRRASRRRYVPAVFSRVFVAATPLLSVLFVSTLAAFCPRSVDINPGQGGKNVCFGHVRSSAAGVRKMRQGERGREGERARERRKKSEDAGSTTFVSRSLIFRVLSVRDPFLSHSLSLSLILFSFSRALSPSSIVLLSVLLGQRFPARFRRSSHFFSSLSLYERTVQRHGDPTSMKKGEAERNGEGGNDYGSG